MTRVFVTGGTGFMGRPLIEALVRRRYEVHALVRPGSERHVPPAARSIVGNPLDASTFAGAVPPGAVVVHLVGTPHPAPWKTAEFQRVDLASIHAMVDAARRARVAHLVYVSVAHAVPVMRAYVAARQQGEAAVIASGIPATILRPVYVLGPGRSWPLVLLPSYAIFRRLPGTRDAAERLSLVTREQMVAALVRAVEQPPADGVRFVEVPEIRRTPA